MRGMSDKISSLYKFEITKPDDKTHQRIGGNFQLNSVTINLDNKYLQTVYRLFFVFAITRSNFRKKVTETGRGQF